MFTFLIVLVPVLILIVIGLRNIQKSWIEIVIFLLYLFSFAFLGLGFIEHDHQYNVAIDPVDSDYTPLGGKHIYSMLVYFILYQISALTIWFKGIKTPPLLLVFCLIFILIGFVLNIAFLIQVSTHENIQFETFDYVSQYTHDTLYIFAPNLLLSILIGILLIYKIIIQEKEKSENRIFKNKFLNQCNQFLSKRFSLVGWSFIFLSPVFVVVTLILILFGQDYNSLIKVFTETTTWTFSQKMYPPPLDHSGHYLCTVSAKGNPKIVKPIRIGNRHGNPIIVNRQLQIANAWEELIADFSPKFHRFIRRNYDKYGYNLSVKINTERASNITYLLMKPLEWVFLICLYLFVEKPEEKIKRQYI